MLTYKMSEWLYRETGIFTRKIKGQEVKFVAGKVLKREAREGKWDLVTIEIKPI